MNFFQKSLFYSVFKHLFECMAMIYVICIHSICSSYFIQYYVNITHVDLQKIILLWFTGLSSCLTGVPLGYSEVHWGKRTYSKKGFELPLFQQNHLNAFIKQIFPSKEFWSFLLFSQHKSTLSLSKYIHTVTLRLKSQRIYERAISTCIEIQQYWKTCSDTNHG